MALLRRETEEEKAAREAQKAAEREQRAAGQAEQAAADEAERRRIAEFQRTLPRWEYQVKRIGEDKQKGLLGSGRMEQILNGEGQDGWELVVINEERATFKRQLPPSG